MKKNQIITIKLDRSYLFDAGGKAFDHAGDVLQVRVLDVLTNYVRVVTLDGQRDYEVKKTLVVKEVQTVAFCPTCGNDGDCPDCEPVTKPAVIIADITKEIVFDHGDYAMYISIDGKRECIGYAKTYGAAEVTTNQYAYDFLMDSQTIEAACELLMGASS